MNPDLIKAPAIGCFPKTLEFIKQCYNQSHLVRHMALIDCSLLLILIVAVAAGWSPFNLVALVMLIVAVLDVVSCFLQ